MNTKHNTTINVILIIIFKAAGEILRRLVQTLPFFSLFLLDEAGGVDAVDLEQTQC